MGRKGRLFQGGFGPGGGPGADQRDEPGWRDRQCRPGGLHSWRLMLLLFRAVPSLFGHRGAERKSGHVRPALPQALCAAFRPKGPVRPAGGPLRQAYAGEVSSLHPGPLRLPASQGDRPLACGIFKDRGQDEVPGVCSHRNQHLPKGAGRHRQKRLVALRGG